MLSKILSPVAELIDSISEITGRLSALLVIALVLLVSYDVAMRYIFQSGSVALQELEWHLFAAIFLLGAAYTLKYDEHVRVDVIYQRLSPKGQAIINLLGCLLMLIPFAVLLIYSSIPFVEQAYTWHETSPDPGGLTHRWIIKALIPFGLALLILQAIAMICRSLMIITNKESA